MRGVFSSPLLMRPLLPVSLQGPHQFYSAVLGRGTPPRPGSSPVVGGAALISRKVKTVEARAAAPKPSASQWKNRLPPGCGSFVLRSLGMVVIYLMVE